MNTIEEQLWNYIDGNCNANEKAEIEAKIAIDPQYQKVYQELLIVQETLHGLDLDEPSLSFTRNVMDQVKLEPRPVTLKTKVDNRIIYAIGSFFTVAILGIFGYAIAISDFGFDFELPSIDFAFNAEKIGDPTFLKIFILVDVALGLLYLDSFLRKRRNKAAKH